MPASPGERAIVILGVMPLLAAAVWLLVLREPTAAVASAAGGHAGVLAPAEVTGLAAAPSFVGVIVAGQDAELGAEFGGEVVRAFKEPGARVKRGEPLLKLAALSVVGTQNMASAQALEDRASVEAAKLALESARDQLERINNAPSAYSARDVQTARGDVARAVAELERLRATSAVHRATLERELARADKQLVRAPFDGVLAARFLDVGDFAGPGQALARVVDDIRLVRFALPASAHARLQLDSVVKVVPSGSDLPISAIVIDVDPELDAAAGMGFARARFTDAAISGKMLPGSRVEVFLDAERSAP
ncbi:MAG: HlyD family efflux transporter periplasmic adaptor subunit [Polyangiales bacterium]